MPLPLRRSLAGLATLGAVAFIAGCGGGSDSLSAEEFRSQADAICADTDRQIDGLTEPTSGAQVLAFLRAGLPIQEAQLEKLRDLEPPEELKADFDEAMGLLEQQTTAIDAAADRIEGGEDAEAVLTEVNDEISGLGDQADAKAEALGLSVCGEDSDSGDATVTTGTAATSPVETAPTTPADTTGAGGDTAAYVADVQEAAGALQEFGTLLQSTTGLEDLRTKIPQAQASLDTFDAAIAELEGYTLSAPRLEEQRAGLARTGPAVSDVLRRFLDAAEEGDLEAVQALVPEVTQTIGEFQAAATG
jgi:hypothetical protein